jgi:hypothetical protein
MAESPLGRHTCTTRTPRYSGEAEGGCKEGCNKGGAWFLSGVDLREDAEQDPCAGVMRGSPLVVVEPSTVDIQSIVPIWLR